MMLLMTILMSSCDSDAKEESKHKMKCKSVGESSIQRCENDEVICYRTSDSYRSGLSCYFKQTLIIKDGLDALNSTLNSTD